MYGRKENLGYMAKMHVRNNTLLSLQLGFLGILFGLKCGMVRDCAREVSLVQVSCVMMFVFVAPPTLVGAWPMALVLWQLIEYYYYYYLFLYNFNLRCVMFYCTNISWCICMTNDQIFVVNPRVYIFGVSIIERTTSGNYFCYDLDNYLPTKYASAP